MKKFLIIAFIMLNSSIALSQTVEYELVHNKTTQLYEAYMVVTGTNTFPFAFAGVSNFTIVVPSGFDDAIIPTTGIEPANANWDNDNNIYAPTVTPDVDYRRFTLTNPGTQYSSFTDGDRILLFTFSLGGGCVGDVRLFDNASDPGSGEEGMAGIDVTQRFTANGIQEKYTGNISNASLTCRYIQDEDGPWDIATNWIDNVVPTIDDNAIIDTNVDSYLRADQAVNNLELRPGSTVSVPDSGNPNDRFILNIVGNIINNGDFTLYNANQDNSDPLATTTGTNGNPNVDGEVLLNGPATQTLSGTGNYYNLRVNNPNGVDVLNNVLTDPTEINGILFVDNGSFTTSDNVLLPCFFEDLGTNDFANGRAGQIGPIGIGGSISGDVRVEQCYPGRRAYRYVSASTTTTTSIQDNWQENQGAYNQFPANATQIDVSPVINGIPYGFGTHITGLGYLPGHSPTGPGAVDQTDGLDWQPSGNPSMFEFDESTQSFNPVLATEPTTLAVGKAYSMIIRGSREVDLTTNASPTYNTKLRSTGTAVKGNVTINTTVNAVPTPIARQYVFVGNPFHAIVNMIDVFNNSTGLNQFVYAFNPTLGSNQDDTNDTSVLEGNRGAFVTIDLTEPPTSGMTNFLQAYQGVFMDASVLSPSIVFSESDKAVREQQLDVFSTPTDRITITLYDQNSYAANNTAADKLIVKFGQTKNSGIDFSDALKFFNPNENLGRLEGSSLLAIENRGMPQTGEVLDLFTTNYRTTDYVFVVKVDGLLDNTVSLYDNYTGTETVLNNDASTAVSFSVDPANPVSEATDRFELRFATSTLGTTDFDLQGISVYPNPASDILNINLGDNTGRFESLELFDINGRLVANKNLSNNVLDVQLDVNSFSSGVYLLKVSSGSEQFSTKVIIK